MNIRRFERLERVILVAMAVSLAGCYYKPKTSSTASQAPTKYVLSVSASPTINRDLEGNPLSVVVRCFMLKDKTEFSKLTFDFVSSGRTDAEMLGTEFLGKSEIVVVPGSIRATPEDMPPDTKYVGIVAFFRKPDPNYWRYLVSVDAMMSLLKKGSKKKGPAVPTLAIRIEDCYLSLTSIKPELIPGQPENAKPDCGSRFSVSDAADPSPTNLPTELPKPTTSTTNKPG